MILTPFLPVPAQIFHAALLSAGRWRPAAARTHVRDYKCDMIPSLPGAGCVAEYWLNVHNNSEGDRHNVLQAIVDCTSLKRWRRAWRRYAVAIPKRFSRQHLHEKQSLYGAIQIAASAVSSFSTRFENLQT
jgi:hypothetical protein